MKIVSMELSFEITTFLIAFTFGAGTVDALNRAQFNLPLIAAVDIRASNDRFRSEKDFPRSPVNGAHSGRREQPASASAIGSILLKKNSP